MAITKEIHGKVDEKRANLSPQCNRILTHLEKRGTITAMEALNFYGVMNCKGRIFDLREAGYQIRTKMVERFNRYNEKVHVARYELQSTD